MRAQQETEPKVPANQNRHTSLIEACEMGSESGAQQVKQLLTNFDSMCAELNDYANEHASISLKIYLQGMIKRLNPTFNLA